jgi:hypothetical protein
MRYVGSRHPVAKHNPHRSVPFLLSRTDVLGPTPLETAWVKLTQLRSYLPGLIEGGAYLCKTTLAASQGGRG